MADPSSSLAFRKSSKTHLAGWRYFIMLCRGSAVAAVAVLALMALFLL